MSISRRLPQSDETRDKALTLAKVKSDSIPVANQFLTAATKTRLNASQPLYKQAMQKRGNALAAQAGATMGVSDAFAKTKMFISHFIQVFNLGVFRGKYLQQHRAFYQLDVTSDSLPPLNTRQDVALWGQRIQDGDAARTSAGGAAMANPTAAEVTAEVTDFVTKNTGQSTLKDDYDNKQEDVAALQDETDKVIKKVWDEVDTFYNEEEMSSKRRKCREWGIIYVSDIELTFNLTAVNTANDKGIENVVVQLLETGNTTTTNPDGKGEIKSTIMDEATFRFTHPDFDLQDIVVTLPSGTTVFEVKAKMVAI
jgi:hypothetical protein